MEGDWLLEDASARKITKVTMTAKEAAKYIGICYPKLLELIAANEVPYIKLGRLYYFTKHGIDHWIDEQQNRPSKDQEVQSMMQKKYPHLTK